MQDAVSVLKKYFGFSHFRPMQKEIIDSVLQGNDTLALLSTGGGKSICFQVPALCNPGLCLVISPLIALMLDQVENLKKKNISAHVIWSGMSRKETDLVLDNCIYGDIKFLYVSPERLQTDLFLERFKKMKINLIAVDEAHCISQWGYDFRPPYLRIAEIRTLHPHVPVIALTATATPDVCDDIQEKLKFKHKNIFSSGFGRKNFHLIIREHEHKDQKLTDAIKRLKGSGIVYVRNRKLTQYYSELLNKNNIAADYYHAGLQPEQRQLKQKAWIENKIKVIVCTNAFGMGIDKPDVRFVLHCDVPESPEAYFQEAGRAGRDGKPSYAGIFFNAEDSYFINNYAEFQYPTIDEIKQVYHALGNFFQLAIGSGKDASFDFDLIDFCTLNHFYLSKTLNSLKILEQQNYIWMTGPVQKSSFIKVIAGKSDLYKFQVENSKWDEVMKAILRLTPGVFEDFVPINEKEIGRYLQIHEEEVQKKILYLQKLDFLIYQPVKNRPQCVYLTERLQIEHLNLDMKLLKSLQAAADKRARAMYKYITNKIECRMQLLLQYFGEKSERCGNCDICIEKNKMNVSDEEFLIIYNWIYHQLKEGAVISEKLFQTETPARREVMMEVLSYLTDNNLVLHTAENMLVWNP